MANSRDELQPHIDAALREIEKIQGEVRDFKKFLDAYKITINNIPDENDKNQAKEMLDRLLENEKKANGMVKYLETCKTELMDDKNPEPVIKNHLEWAKKMSDLNKQLALISGLDELSKKVTESIPYVARAPREERKPLIPRMKRLQPAQSFNDELADKMIKEKSFPELPKSPGEILNNQTTVVENKTKKPLPQPVAKPRESGLSYKAEIFCLDKAVSAYPDSLLGQYLLIKKNILYGDPENIASACDALKSSVSNSSFEDKNKIIQQIETINSRVRMHPDPRQGYISITNTDSLEKLLLNHANSITAAKYENNINSLKNISKQIEIFEKYSRSHKTNNKIIGQFKAKVLSAKHELNQSGDPGKVLNILKGKNNFSTKVNMKFSSTLFSKNASFNDDQYKSMIENVETIAGNFEKRNNPEQTSGYRNRK